MVVFLVSIVYHLLERVNLGLKTISLYIRYDNWPTAAYIL